jgi:hypothetical protein
MEYQVRKRGGSRPAWQYRGNVLHSWSYFPDKDAESIEGMKRYLSQHGDNPILHFVDDDGNSATYVEVTKKADRANLYINGGERFHTLMNWDIWPLDEQLSFLQSKADDEKNMRIGSSDKFHCVREHLLDASDEVKSEYKQALSQRIIDDNITSILKEREGESVRIFFNG